MKTLQVGILIPWVNTAMEEEIPYLTHPDIGLHWSRLRPNVLPKDGHDDSYLEHMLVSIPEALSKFDGLNLHVIVLGCTSATLAGCCSKIEIPEPYRNLEFITAFDAVIFQIRKIRAKTLLLFAPYEQDMIEAEVQIFKSRGVDIVKYVSLPYQDQIRYITPMEIYDLFIKEYTPQCDAVFFSCTALYTLEAIDIIKRGLHIEVPLFSSNTAISIMLNDLYNHRCPKITNR